MNRKNKTFIWIGAFVAFILVAYLVYDPLAKMYSTQGEAITTAPSSSDLTSSDVSSDPLFSSLTSSSASSSAKMEPVPSQKSASSKNTPPKTVTSSKPGTSIKARSSSAPAASAKKFAGKDFTVYDGSGNPVKLSGFAGKPIVLNFWASWCGPCKEEMPYFDSEYQSEKSSVAFVMVNLTDGQRETQESAQQFITGQGYTFPIYFDLNQEAVAQYSIYSIPQTFFFDKDGNMVSSHMGSISANDLSSGIALAKQ